MRYNDRKLLRIADVVSAIASSALPIGSIIALNCISRVMIQLVVVAVFTMIFALMLTLMTNARRVETFAATSAYVHPRIPASCD